MTASCVVGAHHVGLTVRDLSAATAWYRIALEMTEEFAFHLVEVQLRGVVLRAASGFGIELIERVGHTDVDGRRFDGPLQAALSPGFTHLAIQVRDLDDVVAHLLGHGAQLRMCAQDSPQVGWRMAFVADPEGNLIELVEPVGPEAASGLKLRGSRSSR